VGFAIVPTIATLVFVALAHIGAVMVEGRSIDLHRYYRMRGFIGVVALFATLQAFLLGLPIYLLVTLHRRFTAVGYALFGAALAAAPYALPMIFVSALESGPDMRAKDYFGLAALGIAGATAGLVLCLIETVGLSREPKAPASW
jgi:hypothetical protein